MLNFIKFFRGYLYVTVRGYSPERFLNLCSHLNIVLWDLQPDGDGYAFFISLQAFRKLKPLLKKTGTRIHIRKRYGLPFLLFRYRRHRFFFCGIACAFAVLAVMSQFVWKVEVSGNSYYSSQVLLEFLEESGVGYGVLKKKTDCEQIQTMLRARFDDITWVSARLSGTRLYLVIQERVEGAEDIRNEETNPADLVASCDGTVDAIAVRSGTPQVEKGSAVRTGDVLVSGRIDIVDDAGEITASNFCRADADVAVHTTFSYENTIPANYTRNVKTGRKRFLVNLLFGKYQLKIGRGAPDKDGWDTFTRLYPVRVGKDFYLPFQVSVTRCEQFVKKQDTYSDRELKAKAEKEFIRYCEKLKENGIQILSNSVIIDKNGVGITAHGTLDVVVMADEFRIIDPAKEEEGIQTDGNDTADHGSGE